MPSFKADCGCELYAYLVGGCFGFHDDDDYCMCDEAEIEGAVIEKACEKHGGSNATETDSH